MQESTPTPTANLLLCEPVNYAICQEEKCQRQHISVDGHVALKVLYNQRYSSNGGFMVAKPKPDDRAQSAAFRKAARELGCDDSEDRFKEALRTVAKAKPKPQPRKLDR
jgi:hypothetical protein